MLREDGMAPGTPVVFRFRDNDVSQGGEGAPLAPAYHNALVCSSSERLAEQASLSDAIWCCKARTLAV